MKRFRERFSGRRGSILVFTLILLSLLLVGALSLATATIVGQKSAGDTDDSTQAFQTADSGVEKVLYAISQNKGGKLNDIGCSGSTVSDSSGRGSFEVSFYSKDGNQITGCGADIRDIGEIKSVGTYSGTTRAIKTAVAASCADNQTTKVVAENTTAASFTAGDFSDIMNFIGDGGMIAGASCAGVIAGVYPSYIFGIESVEVNDNAASFFSNQGGDGLSCDLSGCEESSGAGRSCSQGWKVIGFCN